MESEMGMAIRAKNAKKFAELWRKLLNPRLPGNTAVADAFLAAKYPQLYGPVRENIVWSEDFDKPGRIKSFNLGKHKAFSIPSDPIELKRAVLAETRAGYDPLMGLAEVRRKQPSIGGALEALSSATMDYWKNRRGSLPNLGGRLLGDLGTRVHVPMTVRQAAYDATRMLGANEPQTFEDMPRGDFAKVSKIMKALANPPAEGKFDRVQETAKKKAEQEFLRRMLDNWKTKEKLR